MAEEYNEISNAGQAQEPTAEIAESVNPLEHGEDDSAAKWYVIHTYSGHENKVEASIKKIAENRKMSDLILKTAIPMELVTEIRNGKATTRKRKMFPGYVLVKMIVTNESWYLVRNTQGVTGFVGHGSEPIPLTEDEIRRMIIEKVHVDLKLEVGESVRIIGGGFAGKIGVVDEINLEKERVKLRLTESAQNIPIDLEMSLVDKII